MAAPTTARSRLEYCIEHPWIGATALAVFRVLMVAVGLRGKSLPRAEIGEASLSLLLTNFAVMFVVAAGILWLVRLMLRVWRGRAAGESAR